DGGKRAVLREEHEVSRKAIAQGRPECSRCPVCSCAFLFAQIARETAGAASTWSSLRPLIFRRAKEDANLGRLPPRERETISTVIASAAKQSIVTSCTERWIASLRSQRRAGDSSLDYDCRSAILVERLRPTACRGMFDGMFEGFITRLIGRHV